jgi:hypothetical protein
MLDIDEESPTYKGIKAAVLVAQSFRDTLVSIKKELVDGVAGMLRYETRAARDAVKKPDTFRSWQAEFYSKIESDLRENFTRFNALLKETFKLRADSEAATRKHIAKSRADLTAISSLPEDKQRGALEGILLLWESRPEQEVAELLTKAT